MIGNLAADATTTPGILGVPPGQVELITYFLRYLTITVLDQLTNRYAICTPEPG